LLRLFHLAYRIGEVRGRYNDGRSRVSCAAKSQAWQTPSSQHWKQPSAAERIAGQMARAPRGRVPRLRAWPCSAAYGAAKLLEASGMRAYDQDIEEFVISSTSPPRPMSLHAHRPQQQRRPHRAEEVARLLRNLRRPVVTLSDTHDRRAPPHQAGVSELWHPMLHIAPLALLARE